MASAASSTPPSSSGYSFVSYPPDYGYPPSPYIPATQPMPPTMSQSEMPSLTAAVPALSYPPPPAPPYAGYAYAHMAPLSAPPNPMVTHLAASPPVINPNNIGPAVTSPPAASGTVTADRERRSAESKIFRHMMTAVTKMQNTMKEFAERHEQIFDRMSLLEQRVGRIDDSIGRILENSDQLVEETKEIRSRLDENESAQEALESRLHDLLDDVVDKFIDGIGNEIKDIKSMVKTTERCIKRDTHGGSSSWDRRLSFVTQQMHDRELLGQEAQEEVRA